MGYPIDEILEKDGQRQVAEGIKSLLRPLVRGVALRLNGVLGRFAAEELPRFANAPKNLVIDLPRRISEPQHMHFGDDVRIGPGSLLIAQTRYPSREMQRPREPLPVQRFEPMIVIGNRVTATGQLTITAMRRVVVQDDVMFATNVIVMDGLHGFQHTNVPYKYQPMWRIAPVIIGRGCWIAQNVVIMPGVTIGEMSIIGANSIVTRGIPSRCVAFGNPARVVKRWDPKTQDWVDVQSAGRRRRRGD